jgi:predicted metal-binding protein
VRRPIARFSWAILIMCEVGPLEAYAPSAAKTKEDRKRTLAFHKASGQIVCDLEVEAYKDGYHLAMGFGGGSCKDYLCQGMICQYLDSGRCRFPHRARPAMEAVGIDVVVLVNKAGGAIYPLVGNLSTIPCAMTVGLVLIC